MNKNDWKLSFFNIFAFSSAYFWLMMKYYHLNFFFCRKHAWSSTIAKNLMVFQHFPKWFQNPWENECKRFKIVIFQYFCIFLLIFWTQDDVLSSRTFFCKKYARSRTTADNLIVFQYFLKNFQGPKKWIKMPENFYF